MEITCCLATVSVISLLPLALDQRDQILFRQFQLARSRHELRGLRCELF